MVDELEELKGQLLVPARTVGVMGDDRTEHGLPSRSSRSERRLVYDVTSKPPGTIERE